MPTTQMQEMVRAELANLLGFQNPGRKSRGAKHDSSGTVTAVNMHGPGGLLNFPGVDPMVFSTIVGTLPGILNQLPTKASIYTDPMYEVVTGVRDQTGANKVNVCDNAPVAGLMKAGKHTAPFGRYELSTSEIELNRIGKAVDRADPMDLRLMNSPIGSTPFSSMGVPAGLLTNDFTKALFERAVAFHRLLARQAFVGSSLNNSVGGGYREMEGLNRLVNTGYVDAETGIALPSLDSDVKNLNFRRVDSDPLNFIVNYISTMFRYLRTKALRQGVDPVRWVIAMRPELWWELTKVWPCAYYLGGCTVQDANGRNVNIDARDSVDLRDQMRDGNFLLVDGFRVEVVLEDGITELTPATSANVTQGCFASDIYILPMSVMGGTSSLYLEYFDMQNTGLQSAVGTGLVLARATAGGAFLEWPRQTNQCIVLQAKIEPRIVLRTPWLAGRIRNVMYCPLQHTPTAFPTDPYFQNGGSTGRSGPSYFGPEFYA